MPSAADRDAPPTPTSSDTRAPSITSFGVLMMNIITAAFLQSSSAIYFSRFIRFVEEMLVAPLSYMEMVVGSLTTVVVRATVTGMGILILGLFFGATTIESWPLFVFWIVAVGPARWAMSR